MSTLIYILRRDLRVVDNPIFHAIAQTKYTHLLPLYILPPHQIEVSGFIPQNSSAKSPFPEARSSIGKFWRCGPHRARFLAEAVWDLKDGLKGLDSDVVVRVGRMHEVLEDMLNSEEMKGKVGAVWLTTDYSSEETKEEKEIEGVVKKNEGVEWRVWNGEEMLIHEDDLPARPDKISDVFTSFRKTVEPLRETVRLPLPKPTKLPPVPAHPTQQAPFEMPSTLQGVIMALLRPLENEMLAYPIQQPPNTKSAHPFTGGESHAQARVAHLLSSGAMSSYKNTRNGLLGEDFSTKLSAWLAMGCISARQIHASMAEFEDKNGGENPGRAGVRFELLWRDYMRLCMRKYGDRLYSIHGFRGPKYKGEWKSFKWSEDAFARFQCGRTGTGLIDASMRELYLTGYTSNRARQNVASYLAKWMGVDWRVGAEWYESCLLDYDPASNWGNWQYVAGVGNDPRGAGDGRKFNPVKQAHDYDPKGDYVRAWVSELNGERDLGAVFQAPEGALVDIAWQKKGGRPKGKGKHDKYGGSSKKGAQRWQTSNTSEALRRV